jgi:hypothetical protein
MSYGKVHSQFWTDRKVRSFSDAAKNLALYLVTGPHRNLIGASRVPDGYIAADLGWSEKKTADAKVELVTAGFIMTGADGWVLVCNQLKYDRIENRNQGVAAFRLVDVIDDPTIKAAAAERVLACLKALNGDCAIQISALESLLDALPKGQESLSEGFRTPEPSLSSSLPDHPPAGADEFDSEFEPIWEIYPRKVGKGAARRAFRAARKKTDLASIVSGIKRMPLPSDPKYIPHLATWLNHERWSDGAVQAIGAPAAGGSLWQQRMATYRPGKFWPSSWGPPPDDPMCECPAEILTEWKRRLERAA